MNTTTNRQSHELVGELNNLIVIMLCEQLPTGLSLDFINGKVYGPHERIEIARNLLVKIQNNFLEYLKASFVITNYETFGETK